MIAIAVWLGVFLDNYESRNPCPHICKIDHEHKVYDNEQNINESDKETSKRTARSK